MRILVDRLWPRGVTKAKARIDLWSKEIAPSTELGKWFHREGEGADWKEFRRRYLTELKNHRDEIELLRSKIRQGPVTLVFSARSRRSEEHTSELQSHSDLVCRLLLEKKKTKHSL